MMFPERQNDKILESGWDWEVLENILWCIVYEARYCTCMFCGSSLKVRVSDDVSWLFGDASLRSDRLPRVK